MGHSRLRSMHQFSLGFKTFALVGLQLALLTYWVRSRFNHTVTECFLLIARRKRGKAPIYWQ